MLLLFTFLPCISVADADVHEEIPQILETDGTVSPGHSSEVTLGTGWFSENQGQVQDPDIYYIYHANGILFGFRTTGYVMTGSYGNGTSWKVEVGFGNARHVIPEGYGELSHKSNYFLGASSSRWFTEVPNYEQVIYRGLYEGIDLVFRASGVGLKYDLMVSPGARPDDICLLYNGIDDLLVDVNGDLHIMIGPSDLREAAPFTYQEDRGMIQQVPSWFLVHKNRVMFGLEEYDTSRSLIIDPLIFSSYLGGSESDNALDLILDSDGNIVITGDSYSTNFPTSDGAYDRINNGDRDIFIFRMSADGSSMISSTLIGGLGQDVAHGIALDDEGNIYVTGRSDSTDFPTTNGAYDQTQNGENDVVVFKMNSECSELLYSTFVGGGRYEVGYAGLQVDASGSAYVAGHTNSADFPTTANAYDTSYFAAGWDGFAFKLEPDGSDLVYSSYFGGWDYEGARDIFIDDNGNAYLTGDTTSDDFPTTTGAYDRTYNGERDGFILVFNQDGSDLVFSTFLGGIDDEVPNALIPGTGDTYWVGGYSFSSDFPVTDDAYDGTINGERDFFISRMTSDGSQLEYSSFAGGVDTDEAWALAADGDVIHIGGRSRSANFPVTDDAIASENGGSIDSIILSLDTRQEGEDQLLFSTYLGGEENEAVWGIEVSDGDLYCTGLSSSTDFPTTPDAYQEDYNGGHVDAVVFRIGFPEPVNEPPVIEITSPENGQEVSGTVTIRGTASDPDGDETLEYVEISVDGGDWELVTGTTDWSFEWETEEEENGDHLLRSRAFDGEDHSQVEELALSVNNQQPNNMPVVRIVDPEDEEEVSGTITITGTASDDDGDDTIQVVEVSVDEGDWEEVDGTDSWEFQWDTTEVEDGEHTLGFRSYDGEDHSEVEEITLNVMNAGTEQITNENIRPTVIINSPANNSLVTGTITIAGSASDEDGTIEKVEISFDGLQWIKIIGTDFWTYIWDTSVLENGMNVIYFRAFDGEDHSDIVHLNITIQNSIDEESDEKDEINELIFVGGTALIAGIAVAVLYIIGSRRGRESCPDCGGKMQYYEEYESWYCSGCEEYKEW